MQNNALRIVLFIALVLLQVLVMNYINFMGYINPIIYCVFILLFPLSKKKTTIYILAFGMGLLIDIFSNTGGMHAAATLAMAYAKVPILNFIQGREDYDYVLFRFNSLPWIKLLTYVVILCFIHQFIFYYLDYFSVTEMINILKKTVLSSLLSGLVITMGIVLFSKEK